jgi:Domain of unknown function (DUF222)/HNH endonuclease
MFGSNQRVAECDIPFDSLPERTAEDLRAGHSTSVFPGGLFDREPGPELAAFLSVVDPNELSGHDQVRVLQAHQRLVSHFQAKVYENIAGLTELMVDFDGDVETGLEATALELRAALRLTRRMANVEIELAEDLKHRLPQVAEALSCGEIDVRRARVLTTGTSHLTESQARHVVSKVIDRAPELTTGELSARVRKLCLSIEPEDSKQRYETAFEQRCLTSEPTLDATTNVVLSHVCPARAAEAFSRINKIAKSLRVSGETRSMDQLRADIALDLLTGTKAGTKGTVNIHVDLETLAELNDNPGDLAGYGPVIADISRQVTEQQQDGEWRFRVTATPHGEIGDPSDLQSLPPLHVGTTKRRPDTEQKRFVELRDMTCVFPGCRMPAVDCDIDHTNPWVQTGRTNVNDLATLCRHDHTGKHRYDWTYSPQPDGDYLWTSRLGHTYTTSGRPPPQPD